MSHHGSNWERIESILLPLEVWEGVASRFAATGKELKVEDVGDDAAGDLWGHQGGSNWERIERHAPLPRHLYLPGSYAATGKELKARGPRAAAPAAAAQQLGKN